MCDCLDIVCVVECKNIRLVLSALCIYVNYVFLCPILGPAVIIELPRKQAGGIQERNELERKELDCKELERESFKGLFFF
jgi:hypothetical protein